MWRLSEASFDGSKQLFVTECWTSTWLPPLRQFHLLPWVPNYLIARMFGRVAKMRTIFQNSYFCLKGCKHLYFPILPRTLHPQWCDRMLMANRQSCLCNFEFQFQTSSFIHMTNWSSIFLELESRIFALKTFTLDEQISIFRRASSQLAVIILGKRVYQSDCSKWPPAVIRPSACSSLWSWMYFFLTNKQDTFFRSKQHEFRAEE